MKTMKVFKIKHVKHYFGRNELVEFITNVDTGLWLKEFSILP